MWILEIAAYAGVAALIAFLFYREFLSPTHQEHRAAKTRNARRRFERRSIERGDRRQRNLGPTEGVERRKGPRRPRDR